MAVKSIATRTQQEMYAKLLELMKLRRTQPSQKIDDSIVALRWALGFDEHLHIEKQEAVESPQNEPDKEQTPVPEPAHVELPVKFPSIIIRKHRKYPDPEEVARQVNEEYYAQKREEELRRKREELTGEPKPVLTPEQELAPGQNPVSGVCLVPKHYGALDWEAKAPLLSKCNCKERFIYDLSLARLNREGYIRHPYASEAFGLICAYLDFKNINWHMRDDHRTAAEDMFTGIGEYFCQASETKRSSGKTVLHVYENVIVLPWDASTFAYNSLGLRSYFVRDFDITGLKLEDWNSLESICAKHDDLIAYLFSRPFKDLPPQIQQGGNLWISPGGVSPIGRGFESAFNISSYVASKASRGVRLKSV
jgi:hypothetical protein